MKNILVVRPDRLGDVILATPVVEALQKRYPEAHVTFLVRPAFISILSGFVDGWGVDPEDRAGNYYGVRGFFALVRELRRRQFDLAVTLQSRRRISAALFLARVPVRIGPWSKLHSYLFFNRGVRQRRSQVQKHEAEYNLDLLAPLGIRAHEEKTHAVLPAKSHQEACEWLKQRGVVRGGVMVAVHPGMGGSALNWSEGKYALLVERCLNSGWTVLMTGGQQEGKLLEKIMESLRARVEGETLKRLLIYGGDSARGIDFLAGLFEESVVVVAPSTGPLHLAVALGKPVVTVFPPIRVQSPKRWGPFGVDSKKMAVIVPELECSAVFACKGKGCSNYGCMESVAVSEVFTQVRRQVERNGVRPSHETSL